MDEAQAKRTKQNNKKKELWCRCSEKPIDSCSRDSGFESIRVQMVTWKVYNTHSSLLLLLTVDGSFSPSAFHSIAWNKNNICGSYSQLRHFSSVTFDACPTTLSRFSDLFPFSESRQFGSAILHSHRTLYEGPYLFSTRQDYDPVCLGTLP
jgi:hypothetical protein